MDYKKYKKFSYRKQYKYIEKKYFKLLENYDIYFFLSIKNLLFRNIMINFERINF